MRRCRFGTARYRADRGAFYIQFTWEGRQHQRRVCAATSKEDRAAQRQAERKLGRVEQGLESGKPLSVVFNEVFGEVTGHKLTFREAAPMYLRYAEGRKKISTFDGDVSRLRGLCRAQWAGKYLSHISAADLTRWASRRTSGKRAVSGATVNRDFNMVSCVFKWAIRMQYADDNPIRTVERFSEKGRARVMWLTVPEIDALLKVAHPQARPSLLCLFDTGMRVSEMTALRWPSVDLERGVVIVEPESTKSGRERHIPVTGRLRAVLERQSAGRARVDGHVFLRDRGRPWTYDTIRRRLQWAIRDCETIDSARKAKTTLHVIRHTFASHLAQNGVSFQEIAHLLGHSSLHVTQRYAHLAPDSGRGAISVLERCFGAEGESQVKESFDPYRAD